MEITTAINRALGMRDCFVMLLLRYRVDCAGAIFPQKRFLKSAKSSDN
jgi:hypothetical protein